MARKFPNFEVLDDNTVYTNKTLERELDSYANEIFYFFKYVAVKPHSKKGNKNFYLGSDIKKAFIKTKQEFDKIETKNLN